MPFDLEDFEERAEKWKPCGYEEKIERRLRFLDGDIRDDVKAELRRQYPETYDGMVPAARNLVPMIVAEKAKAFEGSTWRLRVRGGEDLADDDPRQRLLVRLWTKAGMQLLLEQVDIYTEALGTVFLVFGWDARRRVLTASIWLPHKVDLVADPDSPADLDLAAGVLLELCHADGARGGSEAKERHAFWSARPGFEAHFLLVGDDIYPPGPDNPKMLNPYRGMEEPGMPPAALVPIVAFSLASRDRGLFLLKDEDLYCETLGICASATDIDEIGRHQGFGELYIKPSPNKGGDERVEGGGTRARGPSVAQVLAPGEDVELLSPSPAIDALRQVLQDRIKHVAIVRGLPASSVLADSRTVAAAESLQIERIPLNEYRKKSIARQVPSIERLWYVMRTVWNTHAAPLGLTTFDDDLELVWTPGDLTYRSNNGTPQAAPSWLTVNEWRARQGVGPLRLPDGSLDPRGDLLPSDVEAMRGAAPSADTTPQDPQQAGGAP